MYSFCVDWIEEALTEHDAEGKYYQLLRFLLHSYLKFEQDENIHENDNYDDDMSSSSEDEPTETQTEDQEEKEKENNESNNTVIPKKPSANARAAAAWTMLHQGLALHEVTIEPFSLSEILRLHILSSGVKVGRLLILFLYS